MDECEWTAIVIWRCDEDEYFTTILDEINPNLSSQSYVEMAWDAEYMESNPNTLNPIVKGESYDLIEVILIPYGTDITFVPN